MFRWLFAASLLAIALPTTALAEDGAGGSVGVKPQPQRQEEEEPTLDELKATRAELVEARDAALIQANIYGLPQHRTAAKEKQEEIDRLDQEIATRASE